MCRRTVPIAVLTLIVLIAPVDAAPLPEAKRIPVDLRRTTLVVRDIERSLPFYRDALGLRVIYDQKLGGPVGPHGRLLAPTTRLVLLRANDDFIGVIGLMQRLDVTNPVPEPVYRKAQPGGLILVFNVQDLESRFERICATPHVKVAEPPQRVEYPGSRGGVIPVIFSAVWDADGNYVELNRILGTPAGQNVPAAQEAEADRGP